ncbi:MAG: hypothetical protein RLZZ511_876 [Cyanobacteriota bacterium]|jgi:hypothetical protein
MLKLFKVYQDAAANLRKIFEFSPAIGERIRYTEYQLSARSHWCFVDEVGDPTFLLGNFRWHIRSYLK